MDYVSYRGQTYIVVDPDARLRAPDLKTLVLWTAGEAIPAGEQVGGTKRIPKGTKVKATSVRMDGKRTAFAEVEGLDGKALGWTAAANLAGGLVGETIGLSPGGWTRPPDGKWLTVTDPEALVRGGAPDFTPTGAIIPQGTEVQLIAESAGRSYLHVHDSNGAELGWTAASNVSPGACPTYSDPVWHDPKGPYASWEGGKYLGPRVLVHIVGVGSQVEAVTLDALVSWVKLANAAMDAGHALAIQSGFRSWPEQNALYVGYKTNPAQYNLAAKPGYSNHQNGIALDINTGGFATPIYKWLSANATEYGYIRTVSGEHWHWEYRPNEAPALRAAGKHARASVNP